MSSEPPRLGGWGSAARKPPDETGAPYLPLLPPPPMRKPEHLPLSEAERQRFILDYEVTASWWASLVSWEWAQTLAARYFAAKVRRKLRRYDANRVARFRLEQMGVLRAGGATR